MSGTGIHGNGIYPALPQQELSSFRQRKLLREFAQNILVRRCNTIGQFSATPKSEDTAYIRVKESQTIGRYSRYALPLDKDSFLLSGGPSHPPRFPLRLSDL